MSPRDIIRTALETATSQDLRVIRGASFDRSAGYLSGVDCFGAVLLEMRPRRWSDLTPGWTLAIGEQLGVDAFWLHRFGLGWHRNYQVQFERNINGVWGWSDDPVSALGRSMAREFVS